MPYPDTADTLRAFFAIPRAQIDREIAEACEDISTVTSRITALLGIDPEEQTADQAGLIMHNQLVHARAASAIPAVTADMALFLAAHAAEGVANEACMISGPRLTELESQMEQIRTDEGLSEDEDWAPGEGPEEYEEQRDEADELVDRIEDTVMVIALRRYRLDEVADLYERDRPAFDARREAGRVQMNRV